MFLVCKNMDEKALKQNVEDICGVSPFRRRHVEFRLGKYLDCSRPRLVKLQDLFSKTNFFPRVQAFQPCNQLAANCVFSSGEESDSQIWITGHHDYWAGLGAEDNASSLSLIVELAKYFSGSTIRKHLRFASFDLEEQLERGSRYFVNHMSRKDLKKIKYVLNLECLGSGEDIILSTELDEDDLNNSDLVDKLSGTFNEKGFEVITGHYRFG